MPAKDLPSFVTEDGPAQEGAIALRNKDHHIVDARGSVLAEMILLVFEADAREPNVLPERIEDRKEGVFKKEINPKTEDERVRRHVNLAEGSREQILESNGSLQKRGRTKIASIGVQNVRLIGSGIGRDTNIQCQVVRPSEMVKEPGMRGQRSELVVARAWLAADPRVLTSGPERLSDNKNETP
jgi:hypothetical protein